MIWLHCDCGNDEEQKGFDSYMAQLDMCAEFSIICKNCGFHKVELISSFIDISPFTY